MRKRFAKIKPYLLTTAGVLYMWVFVGTAIGRILIDLGDPEKGVCYPYEAMYFQGTACESAEMKIFWRYAADLPQLFTGILIFTFGFFRMGITQLETSFLILGLKSLLFFIPALALIIIPGFYFWRKIAPNVAWGTLLLLIGYVLYYSDLR